MQPIEFPVAQFRLSQYLNKKLLGEKHDASLEKRAQRLVDNWFKHPNNPAVVIDRSGVYVVGCVLGFELGSIKISRWLTNFVRDAHQVHRLHKDAVALGYVNGYQLFIAGIKGVHNLVARKDQEVLYWKASDDLIPPATSPLFVALERAKTLGYIDILKG